MLNGKIVVPYTDPYVIERCINPTTTYFPCLKRAWNSRGIVSTGISCAITGQILNFIDSDPVAIVTADGPYKFYVATDYTHTFGTFTGTAYNPGTKDFALIVSGYGPSTDSSNPTLNNLLFILGDPNGFPAIRSNSAYSATSGQTVSISKDISNYLKVASESTQNISTLRNLTETTVYKQSANDLEHHLADTNGFYYTASKGGGSTGTIAGGIGAVSNYVEVNGASTSGERFTGIYILEFSNGAPSTAFMKAASLWMASRSDGALYPGFMGIT